MADRPHIEPSRLRFGDVLRAGTSGLRTRTVRAVLSAVGVAIGIASLVGVLGLSESSKSDLLDQIARLGTNLLIVEASEGFGAGNAALPVEAVGMVSRVGTVENVSAISRLDAAVYRNDLVPEGETRGISVIAADETLLETLNGAVAAGNFERALANDYPTVVLGAVAAQRLGIDNVTTGVAVWLGEQWVEVTGILEPFALAADLDRAAMIGYSAAAEYFDGDDVPTSIYVRVDTDWVSQTRDVLPATVDPQNPEEVAVSRPSDALEAQAAAEQAFNTLFLGLGAVALIVGGIGIANVMVIGVMERRGEIGLRRSIGATRRHIRQQFLTESLLLAGLGGVAGVVVGVVVTAGYAGLQGWRIIVPPLAVAGGLLAALAIGVVAGLYPAMRAARMSPTEALRSE